MPLRKTVSEHAPFQERKQQWKRSKSHSAALQQPSSRPLPAVSNVTKSKLKQFRFLATDGGSSEASTKANTANTATTTTTMLPPPPPLPPGSTIITIEDESDKENSNGSTKPGSAQNPPATSASEAPEPVAATPAAKLAWQDLIQMGECCQKEEEAGPSPKDRILWDKERCPEDAFISPMMPRQGRKRARSSSPLSSPANVGREAPVVNVNELRQALRSPHADPALQLWDRFYVGGPASSNVSGVRGGSGIGLANPALAHLIVSSSPRQARDSALLPATALQQHAESGLRRAVSCGTNWPKRRRIDKTSVTASPTSLLKYGNAAQLDCKHSMVSALLETVTGEIEKSNASQPYRQESRSPSPRKRRSSPRKQTSTPTDDMEEAAASALDSAPAPASAGADSRQSDDQEAAKPAAIIPDDEDFGSDDFDDDTLMELDASLENRQLADPCPAPEAKIAAAAQDFGSNRVTHDITDLDDEFGDMDDDLFAAADDLIAGAQSKPAFQQQQQQQQQGQMRHQSRSSDTLMDIKPDPGGEPGADLVPHAEGELEPELEQDYTYADDDAYGDDFGGDFDFEAAELAATQSAHQPAATIAAMAAPASSMAHPSQKPRAIQRYLVTNVFPGSYTDDRGREFHEKILVVQGETTNDIKTVHLRGDWAETDVSTKSFVHIIGDFEWSGMCIVDNNQNMLILHPDQLISSTVVADSFSCTRRAVLQDRVKATSDASPALVYGTILHEIFQDALMANKWDPQFLDAAVDKFIGRHMEDLYTIKVSVPAAREHLLSKMKEMRSWAESFVSAFPRSDAIVHGRHGEMANMCVSKLLDVEEHVWSPMYGLKGNIDATVQVTMRDRNERRTFTVPFEVKTGKNVSSNHQAQTALYNLLLSDRYDLEVTYGVLYYMETSQTLRVPTVRHELRHMIMQRNRLACSIRERKAQLPPMKKAKNACGRCYAQTACFIYHRLADGGDGASSGMGQEEFDKVVGHLTERHREFFLKWEDLLTREEKESQKLRRELWTMVSAQRERLGRCFGDVVIEEGSAQEDKSNPKINRFQYTFRKHGNPGPGFSFLDSQLAVGEPIVVSDEQGHFALALGYVTAVRKHRITVAVDRRLHNARIRQDGFDEQTNQVFTGIMTVGEEERPSTKAEGEEGAESKRQSHVVRYRLDKDEFSNGMATVRNNLVQVMSNDDTFGSGHIRRLVVDLQPPEFKAVPTQYVIDSSSSSSGGGSGGKESLNVDQRRAIEKVMSARDYALVLGMPGTGKTTTIAHIIRALIRQGKSVLLTSYTHTAVDNILLKLKRDGIATLRLGAPAKVHPEVREFAAMAARPMASFEEIRGAWHDSPVVATTCLGINHPLFGERTFDYCIVDEASQITLPVCLGPIRLARTFVLVGDHNQLPPLVQNEEARRGGLDVSLFKLLSDAHPDSVVNLEHQYRMCEDIMTLSNTLIYNGRLRCGTEELRTHRLHIPDLAAISRHHYDAASFLALSAAESSASAPSSSSPSPQKNHPPPHSTPRSFCASASSSSCWLSRLLDPETRVAFVNTDQLLPGSREEAKGNRIVNPCEARLVAQVVDALLTVGVPASEIGVMTHYRSQLALLRHTLARGGGSGSGSGGLSCTAATAPSLSLPPSAAAAVEMHTADRFQGRDKEVVILSLVRSNEGRVIGELLRDWRRINVAFTRAKTKLLVVGSRETLRGATAAAAAATAANGGGRSDRNSSPGAVEGNEMLSRFVRLMEERDWVFDLPGDALESHYFPRSGGGAVGTGGAGDDMVSTQGASASDAAAAAASPGKKRSPKKGRVLGACRGVLVGSGKENVPPRRVQGGTGTSQGGGGPKRVTAGERVLLKGKPILRDVLNDIMGDIF